MTKCDTVVMKPFLTSMVLCFTTFTVFCLYWVIVILQSDIYAPPFEEGGAYCVAHVGRYVGITLCLRSFKLGR